MPATERAAFPPGQHPGPLKEGSVIWLGYDPVTGSHRVSGPATVIRVGRKWVTYRPGTPGALHGLEGRFDLETLRIDGSPYSSPGSVWASKEAWLLRRQLSTALAHLRSQIVYVDPKKVPELTLEKVAKVRELLGMSPDPWTDPNFEFGKA